MELKQLTDPNSTFTPTLLIVPYGIETNRLRCRIYRTKLLIVPYGIETQSCIDILVLINTLLIVPYGIETSYNDT